MPCHIILSDSYYRILFFFLYIFLHISHPPSLTNLHFSHNLLNVGKLAPVTHFGCRIDSFIGIFLANIWHAIPVRTLTIGRCLYVVICFRLDTHVKDSASHVLLEGIGYLLAFVLGFQMRIYLVQHFCVLMSCCYDQILC